MKERRALLQKEMEAEKADKESKSILVRSFRAVATAFSEKKKEECSINEKL